MTLFCFVIFELNSLSLIQEVAAALAEQADQVAVLQGNLLLEVGVINSLANIQRNHNFYVI